MGLETVAVAPARFRCPPNIEAGTTWCKSDLTERSTVAHNLLEKSKISPAGKLIAYYMWADCPDPTGESDSKFSRIDLLVEALGLTEGEVQFGLGEISSSGFAIVQNGIFGDRHENFDVRLTFVEGA